MWVVLCLPFDGIEEHAEVKIIIGEEESFTDGGDGFVEGFDLVIVLDVFEERGVQAA